MSGDDQRRVAASVKQRLLNYSRDRGEVSISCLCGSGPHPKFKKANLEARQALCQQIVEWVWSPSNLVREVE